MTMQCRLIASAAPLSANNLVERLRGMINDQTRALEAMMDEQTKALEAIIDRITNVQILAPRVCSSFHSAARLIDIHTSAL